VLFLIDAQWDFPLVQAIYGQQFYDGFVPELVIVGITWGGKNPDYDKLRAHDLTPTDVSRAGSYGNAPLFLSFITKELIPYVEGKFRVKRTDRTLMGSSFGGLFTLFSMFQAPGVFNRFVLTSPALQWDNRLISTINRNYAEQHAELPAEVFVGIGEYENVPEFQKFVDELKTRKYQHFELHTAVIAGMGHSGGKAEGYSRGLQAVFARPDIHVDPHVLSTYVGEYEFSPQYKVTFVQEEGRLVFILPDNSRTPLKSESDHDFYVPGQFLKVHVEQDRGGKVTGFTLQQYSGSTMFRKVK